MFGKLFNKLKDGLSKTRDGLTDKINEVLKLAITIDDDLYDELEEVLIMADIGMDTTVEIIDRLKSKIRKEKSIEDSIQEKFGTTFFTVPYYSFYLSNQSRVRFEQNVDRSSKTTKAKSLITSIESFLFEMIVNQ